MTSPYSSNEKQYTTPQNVQTDVNMNPTERSAKFISGLMLVGTGLLKRGWMGLGMGIAGVTMLFQSGTGVSYINKLLNRNSAIKRTSGAVSVPHKQGKHVTASITINRPAADIYNFWRNFRNLEHFMPYVKSVDVKNATQSHWSINGPAGMAIEWDAEIINDEPNRVIAWRSLKNPFVDHAGAVRFEEAPNHQGTEVRVEMEYAPLGGAAGMAFAKLLGASPEQHAVDSLRRLKQIMEVGQTPTTDGQPSGRSQE
jgi:uncharacterized membrane protein